MTVWGDLNARARGLSGRLLDRAELERLARAEPAELAARLLGHVPAGAPPPPLALERAVRRQAMAILAILARWAGEREETLAVVLEEEDLRSMRRLLRGAAAGISPDRRLAGLLPTRALSEATLAGAAEAASPADVLARLARAGHPVARALRDRAGGIAPDLFRLEVELARGFSARFVRAARRGGGRLSAHARRSIDLLNAGSVLSASAWRSEVDPAEAFVEAGKAIDAERFRDLASTEDPIARRRGLAAAFAGSPLARPFADLGTRPEALAATVLRARIEEERQARRLDPLGPAPLLELALRLRAQVHDLQAVIWGTRLAAPPEVITAAMATP